MTDSPKPLEVLIAGGGVAGLEALLALRSLAGDRVRLTLVAPDPEFSYRPLAVAEPFAQGRAHRVPLSRFTEDAGASLVLESVVGVDDAAGEVRLGDGSRRSFDALLLSPGGRAVVGVEGATTWWPSGDSDAYGGLLRDLEEGYTKRLAIVVPPGAVWPLPAYELALMTVGEAEAMGQTDVSVTVVTPERAPLSLFGEEASAAVAEELQAAGIELRAGVVGRNAERRRARPGARRREAGRAAGPGGAATRGAGFGGRAARRRGLHPGRRRRARAGLRTDVGRGRRRRVAGQVRRAGDAPGAARLRGDRAAGRRGGRAGPRRARPARALADRSRHTAAERARRLRGRALWWPAGKISGEYLPRWLTEHGVAPTASAEPPSGGITVKRPLRDIRGAEAQYLYDLSRRFTSGDPQIAALGRRMTQTRER